MMLFLALINPLLMRQPSLHVICFHFANFDNTICQRKSALVAKILSSAILLPHSRLQPLYCWHRNVVSMVKIPQSDTSATPATMSIDNLYPRESMQPSIQKSVCVPVFGLTQNQHKKVGKKALKLYEQSHILAAPRTQKADLECFASVNAMKKICKTYQQ